jgi:hypothetical protein
MKWIHARVELDDIRAHDSSLQALDQIDCLPR